MERGNLGQFGLIGRVMQRPLGGQWRAVLVVDLAMANRILIKWPHGLAGYDLIRFVRPLAAVRVGRRPFSQLATGRTKSSGAP